MIKKIWRRIKRFFSLPSYYFERIEVEEDVVRNICALAKSAYPLEFLAFLNGRVVDKVLKIRYLSLQAYYASENRTSFRYDFALASGVVGTVHSHPGPSNRPSNADRFMFSKHGMIHMIIKHPYRPEDIECYNKQGRPLRFVTQAL